MTLAIFQAYFTNSLFSQAYCICAMDEKQTIGKQELRLKIRKEAKGAK